MTIDHLRAFKDFINQQDKKRNDAEKNERDQAKIIEAKMLEIADYEAKLASLKAKLAAKTRKWNRCKDNKQYLSNVLKVKSSEEQYHDIDELITRYEILHKTNVDLTEQRAAVQSEQEKFRERLNNLLKSKRSVRQ